MKFSILIPLYNKEKYIERCLESLLAQDLSPEEYEIIIVDDGSKDSGPLLAQKYTEKNANIKLIRQQNQGPSAARNNCLAAATGDYLYFLDADDYLATDILNTLLELATQNNLDILEFNTIQIADESVPETIRQEVQDVAVDIQDGIAYVAAHGFRNEAWRYIIKKDFLSATGIQFIKGTLYEDAIFTASVFLKAQRMAKVNLDVHRYVVVENSIVTSKDTAHNLKFINGMQNAVEHFHGLIQGLNKTHAQYQKAVKQLKSRQQAFVFALIIRTLRFRLLSTQDLETILNKLHALEAYPIDPKIGGIGMGKKSLLYKTVVVPVFNNKTFLFLGLRGMKLIPA